MSGAFRESIEAMPPVLAPAASPGELLPAETRPTASAEEKRALDAAFTQPQHDSTSAGVLGFLSAGMLLGQIVHDTLAPPADETEADEKKKLSPPEPIQ
jgi:hypothetical protein